MPVEASEKLCADLSEQVIHGEQHNKSSAWTVWQEFVFVLKLSNKMWIGMFWYKM